MAANKISVQVGVDGEKEFKKSMSEIVQTSKTLASEMKLVESSFDKNASAQKKAKAQAEVLTKQIENQQKQVNLLRERYEQSVKATGEESKESLKLKESLNKAETALNKMNQQLDEFPKKSDKVKAVASKIGEGLKKGIAASAKAVAVGLGAVVVGATKAAFDIGKQAVEAYSEFEQLKGGVEKLFGTGGQSLEEYAKSVGKSTSAAKEEFEALNRASAAVISNADQAFKTAGMDANTYIQNVTGFSAALIKSVGGNAEKAASLADTAMRDIADNANTFGTKSAEELAQVYQALAKGTFTTLDNLNLGYGGSKKGMEELIADANKLKVANGEMADLSIDNFDDMVEAIHLVQVNMGIAGATEKEAMGTIQGSIGMLKSSWQNLLTGLADPTRDLNPIIDGLIESVTAVATNLLPIISKTAKSIADTFPKLFSELIPQILPMVMDLLPAIANAILSLTSNIVALLPDLIKGVVDFLVNNFVPAILNMLPEIINSGLELIFALAEGIAQALPGLIPQIIDVVILIVETLLSAENISRLVDAALQIIVALGNGLIRAIPTLLKQLPTIITNIVKGLLKGIGQIASVGGQLISGLWNGINDKIGWIVQKIQGFGSTVISAIKGIFGIHSPSRVMRDVVGRNLALGIGVGFSKEIGTVSKDMQRSLKKNVNFNLPTSAMTMSASAGASSSYSYNIPAINVYAANGQSAEEIANATLNKLQREIEIKRAVWR